MSEYSDLPPVLLDEPAHRGQPPGRDEESDAMPADEALSEGVWADLETGAELADGRFQLVKMVGWGPLSRVWLAFDRESQTTVAVKLHDASMLPPPERDDRISERYRLLARLGLPGMVRVVMPVVERGELRGAALEYAPGGDLRRMVLWHRIRGPHLEGFLVRAAEALAGLHDAGSLHRNLKPTNILLAADRSPRLADPVSTAVRGGFSWYQAPEVLLDPAASSPRSDVYSLAMCAIFGLYGRDLPPTRSERPERLCQELNCRPAVARVLCRAVQTQIDQRPANALELAQALVEATRDTRGSVIEATDPTPGSRSDRHARSTHVALPFECAIRMIPVPRGIFEMGCEAWEAPLHPDEAPSHAVRVSGFLMSITPITALQWRKVMGSLPPLVGGLDRPVTGVSWLDAVHFANTLSALDGRTAAYGIDSDGTVSVIASADGYRLPSEAQWEHACRAGNHLRFGGGTRVDDLGRVAWYDANSNALVQPVGLKDPNPWGLQDMLGGVWEWVEDWYGPYPPSVLMDPSGPLEGPGRVLRGGSWWTRWQWTRASTRLWRRPSERWADQGFRVVLPASP